MIAKLGLMVGTVLLELAPPAALTVTEPPVTVEMAALVAAVAAVPETVTLAGSVAMLPAAGWVVV